MKPTERSHPKMLCIFSEDTHIKTSLVVTCTHHPASQTACFINP
uniref:Uncharacterized protein n=1 Tax=Anguilla anguilla TaxID=7936 RepID=A0A0E9VDG5_ANGAN